MTWMVKLLRQMISMQSQYGAALGATCLLHYLTTSLSIRFFFHDLTVRKHEVMPLGMDYYYLYAIGKDPSHPEIRGSVRKILEKYKTKADKANCALALEAISEHARSVYEYFGFKTYLVFQFGVGEVNSKGEPDPQGKGFTAYLMLYHKDADTIFHA
ncbi:BDH_1b_G0049560.mRNA.1.CDS.1 [Saccharomyces cerevisiae]|uniref:Putative increased recombination centers protein 11 n=1 Tax=Saccharomyces cerevisiae (strain ATCC 204508 / S288c) TaxID=559292 RepID=IRC11_YEAST|nr:RecName: Full=Putative increased recombination centers protein 11 [Saccharomyces cerevisiae S288C]KAJ1534993.1 uncharacterized protein FZC26_26169g3891 [Saccharomyces cerevisiae]KZV07898.1 hypothetical protein WN66_05836 [Saccharomyces cerevisiae]PTN18258.1 hypothetical protein C4S56_0827 [Saccharomyces cerevisiae]CAA60762.1 ORF OR26.03 [Saccharomyces cerevisiae]CAA99201.1 unnamed protein product [Saccharomyces cerevisiae]